MHHLLNKNLLVFYLAVIFLSGCKKEDLSGIKEKLLAAKRAHIKTILIPELNVKDLVEIPKHLLKNITIKPVKTLQDVMKIALRP